MTEFYRNTDKKEWLKFLEKKMYCNATKFQWLQFEKILLQTKHVKFEVNWVTFGKSDKQRNGQQKKWKDRGLGIQKICGKAQKVWLSIGNKGKRKFERMWVRTRERVDEKQRDSIEQEWYDVSCKKKKRNEKGKRRVKKAIMVQCVCLRELQATGCTRIFIFLHWR